MVRILNKFGILRITPETINMRFLMMISSSSFFKCEYMQSNP